MDLEGASQPPDPDKGPVAGVSAPGGSQEPDPSQDPLAGPSSARMEFEDSDSEGQEEEQEPEVVVAEPYIKSNGKTYEFNGHIYHFNREGPKVENFRCSKRNKLQCNATAGRCKKTGKWTERLPHNHDCSALHANLLGYRPLSTS